MDFTTLTVQTLKSLADIVGSYGLAIIVLTLTIRLAMWPLNVSQQRSMRKMQELSPKLKDLQSRYKNNPQMLQRKMAEFYKEHSFNPFGGCFPLLVQMPIFILLYTALMSPQFIQAAGKTSFGFIERLDAPLRSHAGVVGDKEFGVGEKDTFTANKTAKVYLKNGKVEDVKIDNYKKALKIQGEVIPGQPIDFKMNIFDLQMNVENLETDFDKAEITVINNATKELEKLTFEKKGNLLFAHADTNKVKTIFHYDVLFLILLFGASMFGAQKVMGSSNKSANLDPAQKAMQESMAKIMPIMITGLFIFFPIPAGVLLYMITSNVIQVVQTFVVNKQIDKEEASSKKNTVIDVKANNKSEQ